LQRFSFVSTAVMEGDKFVAFAAVDRATADGGNVSVASVTDLLKRMAMMMINGIYNLIVVQID
jgi:hypothetical protein